MSNASTVMEPRSQVPGLLLPLCWPSDVPLFQIVVGVVGIGLRISVRPGRLHDLLNQITERFRIPSTES